MKILKQQPSVTTELVESTTTAASILETPKEEAIPAEPVIAHEEPEVVHQEAEVIQEASEAAGEESEAVAAPDEPVKPIEPETITQPKVEEQPAVEVQPQTARATSSALKDQNDGKIVDHGKLSPMIMLKFLLSIILCQTLIIWKISK